MPQRVAVTFPLDEDDVANGSDCVEAPQSVEMRRGTPPPAESVLAREAQPISASKLDSVDAQVGIDSARVSPILKSVMPRDLRNSTGSCFAAAYAPSVRSPLSSARIMNSR
jgi:hypothetical protein